jgi:GNAT superfamily N-acetyltransferase
MSLKFVRRPNAKVFNALWRFDQIDVYDDEAAATSAEEQKPIGYLRISYVPSEHVSSWNDVYRFLADRGGSVGICGLENPETASLKQWQNLAYRVQEKLAGRNAAIASEWENKSLEDVRQGLEKFRPHLDKLVRPRREHFCLFHVDKPLVDYIKVEEPWLGKGVGQALYKEGAAWMAERSMALHASALQSPSATLAWKRMEDKNLVDSQTTEGHDGPRRRLRAP